MNSYRSSSEETDDEEMEDDNSIFDRPVRDLLYQKVQRLEREEGHQMGGATCPRNDSNFSYGRRVPRHVKVPQRNLIVDSRCSVVSQLKQRGNLSFQSGILHYHVLRD
jgi:hypothetical protein